MLSFLSSDWVSALHREATASATLGPRTAGVSLVIEQVVTGGPIGDVRFHVRLDRGVVSVRSGAADSPTLRFSQDYETAVAIASGTGSAQRAFMTGRLRVGGDLSVLLEHGDVLAELDDVFAAVRARTDLAAVDARSEVGSDDGAGS